MNLIASLHECWLLGVFLESAHLAQFLMAEPPGNPPEHEAPAEVGRGSTPEMRRAHGVARKAAATDAVNSVDWKARLEHLVRAGKLREELDAACSFASAKLSTEPTGTVCPLRSVQDIRDILPKQKDKTRGVQMGASLGMLNLKAHAYPVLSPSRIAHILGTYWNGVPSSLQGVIGTIPVNSDLWETDSFASLVRSNCDSEPEPWAHLHWHLYVIDHLHINVESMV